MNAFCASEKFDAFTAFCSFQPGKIQQKTLPKSDPDFRGQITRSAPPQDGPARSAARRLLDLSPDAHASSDDEDLVGSLPPTADTLLVRSKLASTKLNLLSTTRIICFVGRGNTGKTTVSRFVAEEAASQERSFFVAACDFGERSLSRYVTDVMVPKNNDLATSTTFLRKAIEVAGRMKVSGLVDLGASGETILMRLHEQGGFLEYCKSHNVVPVFIHTIATGVGDLAVLKTFQERGIWPEASAIIFNEMLVPTGSDRAEAFDLAARQSCTRKAMAMGTPQLWLPALERSAFQEVDKRGLQFGKAARGEANPDNSLGPLKPHDQHMVRRFLERTRHELSPISSWLL